MSSGYRQGMNNIHDETTKAMDLIRQQNTYQHEDISKLKNRMLDDYATNLYRISQNYDDNMKNIKINIISQLQDMQSKSSLSDANTTAEINKLYQTFQKDMTNNLDDYMKYRKQLNDEKVSEAQQIKEYDPSKLYMKNGVLYNPQAEYNKQLTYPENIGQIKGAGEDVQRQSFINYAQSNQGMPYIYGAKGIP